MSRRVRSALLLLAAAAAGAGVSAQATKTLTVRVLDGRTGATIVPDNVEVRVDRDRTAHVEWVKLDGDGTATVTLPAAAKVLSLHASYDSSMEYYINCDVARQKDVAQETWYSVSEVLTQGFVMPNECGKAKPARDVKLEARPGEFILLVRKRGWHDRVDEMR